jgi:hypothetical protein
MVNKRKAIRRPITIIHQHSLGLMVPLLEYFNNKYVLSSYENDIFLLFSRQAFNMCMINILLMP